MKNIVIIATGGTIAGSGDAGKAADYQAGRISVSDILESVPSIRSLAHMKTVQMCNIDSNDMDEERWIALRDLIRRGSGCRRHRRHPWHRYAGRDCILPQPHAAP